MKHTREAKKLKKNKKNQKNKIQEKAISKSMQIAVIQNGNTAFLEAHSGIDYVLLETEKLSENAMRNIQYQFLMIVSEITQACITGGMGKAEAEALRDAYICKMDRCRKKEEICKMYKKMCIDFATHMQDVLQQDIISWHVRKCMDYIYENLNCDLSIKTLAQLVGLNPSYLSRLFKQETGYSIKQFVISAKMAKAKELLEHTDMSYLEISRNLGFSSQSAFIAMFKKTTALTPKHYRMEHEGDTAQDAF